MTTIDLQAIVTAIVDRHGNVKLDEDARGITILRDMIDKYQSLNDENARAVLDKNGIEYSDPLTDDDREAASLEFDSGAYEEDDHNTGAIEALNAAIEALSEVHQDA
jgi:hypothetical protein